MPRRWASAADVLRVPVFGLGCAGGATGLSIAAQLAQGNPGGRVLLVVVEACTVSFRADRISKADIIATVLFGDGAAGGVPAGGRRRAGHGGARRAAHVARHAGHHGLGRER